MYKRQLQELLRILAGDLYIGVRLNQTHLIHAVQNDIGNFINAVLTVRSNTAGIDICEVRIGAGLLQSNTCLLYTSRCV